MVITRQPVPNKPTTAASSTSTSFLSPNFSFPPRPFFLLTDVFKEKSTSRSHHWNPNCMYVLMCGMVSFFLFFFLSVISSNKTTNEGRVPTYLPTYLIYRRILGSKDLERLVMVEVEVEVEVKHVYITLYMSIVTTSLFMINGYIHVLHVTSCM